MTRQEDQQLIARIQEGDMHAFQTLYEQYWKRVYAHVRRVMGGRGDVEDVVQEVFVQVHRSLPKFRGDSALSTWIYRITWNVSVSHLRKKKHKTVELPALRQIACSKEQWSTLEARDKLRTLYAALDDLPDDYREAFVLFELEGHSLQEIADMLETSLNTVASRVRRSRERLRSLLESAEGAGLSHSTQGAGR